MDLSRSLNLIDVSAASSESVGACGSDGCGCGHGGADAASSTTRSAAAETAATVASATTVVGVTGMTCSHCVSSVTGMLSELPGVDEVSIDLRPDAVSFVTIESGGPIDRDVIRAAVSAAGYTLTD